MAIIFIQVPVFQPTRRDLFAALAPPRTPNSIWASCQPELGSLGSLYSPSKLVPGQIRTHTSRATEGERHTWRAPSAVAYIIHYSGFGPVFVRLLLASERAAAASAIWWRNRPPSANLKAASAADIMSLLPCSRPKSGGRTVPERRGVQEHRHRATNAKRVEPVERGRDHRKRSPPAGHTQTQPNISMRYTWPRGESAPRNSCIIRILKRASWFGAGGGGAISCVVFACKSPRFASSLSSSLSLSGPDASLLQ